MSFRLVSKWQGTIFSLLLSSHVMVYVQCIAAMTEAGRWEKDFQFVAYLKRDQSQYVKEWYLPYADEGQVLVHRD